MPTYALARSRDAANAGVGGQQVTREPRFGVGQQGGEVNRGVAGPGVVPVEHAEDRTGGGVEMDVLPTQVAVREAARSCLGGRRLGRVELSYGSRCP